MQRAQVNDLRDRPELQPTANPVDRFQYMHGAQLSLVNFGQIVSQAISGLNKFTDLYGEEQNALGAEEFQKTYQEALKENQDQAAAFRSAVAKGDLAEAHNPFFVTGFRKAAARELATRYFGESGVELAKFYAVGTQPDPQTGIAPIAAPENQMAGFADKFQEVVCRPGDDRPG